MATKADNTMTTGALMLVGGGILGAGVALLLAPQAGKDTCKTIARYAKRFGRKTNAVIDEFSDSISDFADTVGQKASDILQSGEELTPEVKKEILTAIEKGQAQLEKQKAKLARMIG